ncbi:MAG: hypothetical protein QGG40_00550 [Myxococcota bacterium]|nr:hypothetical protein [Myxococcota bacterium]
MLPLLAACGGGGDDGQSQPVEDVPWEFVDGQCAEPSELEQVPLSQGPELNVQQGTGSLTHLLDVEIDEQTGHAYAVGYPGLVSVDVSGDELELLDFLEGPDSFGWGLFHKVEVLGDGLLAVSNRDEQVSLVDASDPSDLAELASLRISDAAGFGHSDGLLYVLFHTGTMQVWDVSDPSDPGSMGELTGLGNPWEMVVVGELAYVADNTLGLVVLDLTAPDDPRVLAQIEAAGGLQDLWVDGDRLYAAVGAAGVEVFDLTDPGQPVSLGTTGVGRSVVGLSVDAGRVWAATQEGVVVLRQSDLSPLATWTSDEWAMHVVAWEDRAWVANWSSLVQLEMDPSAVAPVAEFTPDGLYFYGVDTDGTLTVTNRGGSALYFTGLSVDDERFSASLDALILEPGASGTLDVQFTDDGGEVDATLCVASNDPYVPVREISLAATDGTTSLALGEEAIDFVLSDLDGEVHQLSEQQGSPVLLVYFATW